MPKSQTKEFTGPRSAVGNVSGTRYESDCRSRGRESIPARSHTFVEIDHEIFSMVILLPSAETFKKSCCQLQAKECALFYCLFKLAQEKVWRTDRPDMTIAVDLGRKATKQTNRLKNDLRFNEKETQKTDSNVTARAS